MGELPLLGRLQRLSAAPKCLRSAELVSRSRSPNRSSVTERHGPRPGSIQRVGDDALAVLVVVAAVLTVVAVVRWTTRLGRDARNQHETDDERFDAVVSESSRAGLAAVALLAPVVIFGLLDANGLAIAYLFTATVVLAVMVVGRRWRR